MYKVSYAKKARKDLKTLEFDVAKRIIRKIYYISIQDDSLRYAQRLKDDGLGMYRFRIGDYRAIFDVDKRGNVKILAILRIKHRKDVYRL